MLKQPLRIAPNSAKSELQCSPIKKKAIEIPYIYVYSDYGRGKRLRLPACLQIENDSHKKLAVRPHPARVVSDLG